MTTGAPLIESLEVCAVCSRRGARAVLDRGVADHRTVSGILERLAIIHHGRGKVGVYRDFIASGRRMTGSEIFGCRWDERIVDLYPMLGR